ncbi:MAG: hypothetical protein ACI88A_001583 [Paraglaciecola sp.]|jgi:hypothetical protein
MNTLHSFTFVIHILFGSMALLLFWVPVMSKKGSLDHQEFGRYYAKVMHVVAASGAVMALLVVYAPLTIKHQFIGNTTDTQALALKLRIFWSFLLYLSVLTFANIRHGILVVKNKAQHSRMRNPLHLLTIMLLFTGGLSIFTLGAIYGNFLHIVFGLFGTILAVQMARFCLARNVQKNAWLVAHIGSFIGSGIGAYTAFIAFGGRHLLADLGNVQMLFWIAPGLVGGIVISSMSRKYQHGLAAARMAKKEGKPNQAI